MMLGVMLAVCGMVGADAPTDREVLRALPRGGSVPFVCETCLDDIVIVKNRLAVKATDVRVPGSGTVKLVTTRWECPVYYTETVESQFPFPVKVTRQRVYVVYIDKHKVGE